MVISRGITLSLLITPADPNHGGGGSGQSDALQPPQGSPTLHSVFGNLEQLQRVIHCLHVNRYADYRRWRRPQAIPKGAWSFPKI